MAAAPAVATSPRAPAGPARASGSPPRRPVAVAAVAVAVAAGVALRLYSRSDLWLDEALTVNIARLPLSDLTDALRRDGAPPLYYVLLHVWTGVFGSGDVAARSLSAVFSIAALPLAYVAGRRRGGPLVGIAALALLATSPFALRYATEARMYSLAALLVLAGWLVLDDARRSPTVSRLAGLGLISGLLLLTHYWAFFLVGVTLVVLGAAWWRQRRRSYLAAAAAIAVGGVVLFAPWMPHFLYQRAHTGTPWGTPPVPIEAAFTTLVDFGGGPYPEGQAIAAIIAVLVLLALFGRAIDHRRIELDIATRPGVRAEALVAAATLLVALVAGALTAQAFASRYTSVIFPLVVMVAAHGVLAVADTRLVAGVLAAAAVLGIVGGVRNVVYDRTQAPQIASAMAANGASPGDVVVYCPDQLGPDVSRILPDGFEQLTFPDGAPPAFVDWVDYERRMRAADPEAFGAEVLHRAAGRPIWFVWMPGYRTLDRKCERVGEVIGASRPPSETLVLPDDDVFERQVLVRYPGTTP